MHLQHYKSLLTSLPAAPVPTLPWAGLYSGQEILDASYAEGSPQLPQRHKKTHCYKKQKNKQAKLPCALLGGLSSHIKEE